MISADTLGLIVSGLCLVHVGESVLYLAVLKAFESTASEAAAFDTASGDLVRAFHVRFLQAAKRGAHLPELALHNLVVLGVLVGQVARVVAAATSSGDVDQRVNAVAGSVAAAAVWFTMLWHATRKVPWIEAAAQPRSSTTGGDLYAKLVPHARLQFALEVLANAALLFDVFRTK
jgi:hypothetical protein